MRRLNVVWVVIAPCRSHALGLDVVGDDVLAVRKRQVTGFPQFSCFVEILWVSTFRNSAGERSSRYPLG